MELSYQIIVDPKQLEQFVDLEIEVWGCDPRDATPVSNMIPVVLNGGVAIGAYYQSKLVGISYGFPIIQANKIILWSHTAAVLPEYQSKGIGRSLKNEQRHWAKQQGYEEIHWSFDPLQTGNAMFNLHYLGAIATKYCPNLYGTLSDELNNSLPSDRLEVTWFTDYSKVNKSHPKIQLENLTKEILILEEFDDKLILRKPKSDFCLIQIPRIKKSKSISTIHWQAALKQSFDTAFENGFVGSDFIKIGDRYFYVLTKSLI